MKIESQLRSCRGAPRAVTKTDKTQAGTFRQALDALPQEPKDTFTPSCRASAAQEVPVNAAALGASAARPAVEAVSNAAPQAADTASVTGIHPKDSIDVKLAKLRKLNEEADYTGMSYGEIYTAIWNRYDEAFDGNWASIMAFSRIQEKGSVAASDFRSEISRNIGFHLKREFKAETGIDVLTWTKDEWSQHKRDMEVYSKYVQSKYGNLRAQALGYGNMTMDEIEQAIHEKYEGKDSVQDFLNLQGELLLTGVMDSKLGSDGASAYWNTIGDQLPKTYLFDDYMDGTAMNISQDRWDAVLDGKFDAHAFAADMREYLKNANFSGWDFDIEGAISQGIDYLLEAVAKAQLAQQERHAEQEKRVEQAELLKQAE